MDHLFVRGPHGELYPFASAPRQDIANLRAMLPVIGRGIEKRASLIANAGDGLFATRDFVKDEIVTFYDGVILPKRALEAMSPACRAALTTHARNLITSAYVLIGNYDARTQLPITADTDTRDLGGGAFLNDLRGPDRDAPPSANVEFVLIDDATNEALFRSAGNYQGLSPFHRIVAVVALRNVSHGAELYVDYGDPYWEKDKEDQPTDAAACDIRPYAVTRKESEERAAAEIAATAARHATTRRITLVPMPLAPRKTAREEEEDIAPPARATKSQRVLPSSTGPSSGPGRTRKQ